MREECDEITILQLNVIHLLLVGFGVIKDISDDWQPLTSDSDIMEWMYGVLAASWKSQGSNG